MKPKKCIWPPGCGLLGPGLDPLFLISTFSVYLYAVLSQLVKSRWKSVSCTSCSLNVRTGEANLWWGVFKEWINFTSKAGRRHITVLIVTVAEWPRWPFCLAPFASLLPSVPQQCFPINKLIFLWIASPSLAHDQSAVEVAVISFFRGKQIRLRSEKKMTLFLQRFKDELKALTQSALRSKYMWIYWHLEEEKHRSLCFFFAALRLWTLFQRTRQILAAVTTGEN